jgi:hypothetical protein
VSGEWTTTLAYTAIPFTLGSARTNYFSDRINDLWERRAVLARQTVVKNLTDPNHAFRYLEKR